MIINNSNFLLGEIPKFNPLTQKYKYIDFWKGEKRKCIEGYWSSGKWMSGPLYFYINFFPIRRESEKSKGQPLELPSLRDIDWELFYLYEECRGFSGFELEEKYTCLREYGPDRERAERLGYEFNPNLTYIPAREYLRKIHDKDLGKPLYKNKSKNFISVQSRGSGKSFSSACLGAHNYEFGGITDYDYYESLRIQGKLAGSETLVGAIKASYSGQLISKMREGLENMVGGYKLNGNYYPCPLFHRWTGNWEPGSNNPVKSVANGSIIYHRTFHDNPLAGNGTRSNLFLFDEVGFWDNIIESWGAVTGGEVSKAEKNQVIWALGTGGMVRGAAAIYVETIFRNPESFNCIEFDDIWEGKGNIGYFVPITYSSSEFKEGPNNITNEEKALSTVLFDRKKLEQSIDKKALLLHMINAPLVPSEAFLSVESNEFPGHLIKEQLSILETKPELINANWIGELKFEEGELVWRDRDDIKPIRKFPMTDNESKAGCIELFEKPNFDLPISNPYIMGADTVDKAKSTTPSLFNVWVFNTWTRQLAAEFTGRRDDPEEAYEICRRLCLYYRCKLMYEQQVGGIFTYFKSYNQLYLLEDTPTIHRNKDTFIENSNTGKGINATVSTNKTGRQLINSWLRSPVSEKNPDYRIIHTIKSIPLLQEMLYWNPDLNTDRISGLIQVMWYEQESFRRKEDDKNAETIKATFSDSEYWKRFKSKKQKSVNDQFNFPI